MDKGRPGAVLQARFQHDKLIDYIERERLAPANSEPGVWTNRLADVAHFRHQIDFVCLQQRTVCDVAQAARHTPE